MCPMCSWMMWPFIAVGLILLIGLIAALVFGGVFAARHLGQTTQTPKTPLTILEQRYARGELSHEQFEEMKRDLSGI